MMQLAQKIGNETFLDYQSRINFGMRTGIDLIGESAGLTYNLENINAATLATNSFGQNFNVTMVQMLAAFSSLINGGDYYQPHLVSKIVSEDGNTIEVVDKSLMKKTITEETSEFLRGALVDTVEDGTGWRAKIDGYTIGGKTGTGEKVGRPDDEFVLYFIGYAGADDHPEVVCYVVIDTPLNAEDRDNSGYASQLWHDVMVEVLPYLNIFE